MINGQKLMTTSTHLISNGWSSGGSSAQFLRTQSMQGCEPRAFSIDARVKSLSQKGRTSVNTHLQGRKIPDLQDDGGPSVEALHLIRKLRWMGMEEEAERAQRELRYTATASAVIPSSPETY
jgi:hypothetical protein